MRYHLVMATIVASTLASQVLASEAITYSYDARGRLVKVMHSGGSVSGMQVTYTHDAANNRTRVQVTGAPH